MTAKPHTRIETWAETLLIGLRQRWLTRGWHRLQSASAVLRAEAELRALDERELHDIGLDRGGIDYAAQSGREPDPAFRPVNMHVIRQLCDSPQARRLMTKV